MIPIPPQIKDILANRCRIFDAHHKICNTRKNWLFVEVEPRGCLTAVSSAAREIGIEGFHFHDLRHSGAQWYHDNGNDVVTIMSIGGWNSMTAMNRYILNAKRAIKNINFGATANTTVGAG
jgi:integrase